MTRQLSLPLFLIATVLFSTAFSPWSTTKSQMKQFPYRDSRLPVDQRVADLLARMTLEEKVAQTQTMWVTNQYKMLADDKGNFSPDEKTRQLLKLGLGQFGAPSQGATDAEKATQPYFR